MACLALLFHASSGVPVVGVAEFVGNDGASLHPCKFGKDQDAVVRAVIRSPPAVRQPRFNDGYLQFVNSAFNVHTGEQ